MLKYKGPKLKLNEYFSRIIYSLYACMCVKKLILFWYIGDIDKQARINEIPQTNSKSE